MKATPHEQRQAQLVAQLMRSYDDLWQRAARAKGSEKDWEGFDEQMSNLASIICLHICHFGNRARFLQLVAEVLDGNKLDGAPHDDVILQAVKIAIKKRRRKNRKAGRGLRLSDLCPPFEEVFDAYAGLTPPKERRDERQVRRRLKALGQGTSPRAGSSDTPQIKIATASD